MTTPRLGLDELIQNQSQPHVPINSTIRLLDALVHLSVIDKDLTSPPGGEADGDTYIVGSGATGAWSGHDDEVAFFQDTGYVFVVPRLGMWAYVEDEGARYQYTQGTGSGWELFEGGGSPGSGAMVFVSSTTVAGAAATDITVSGLSLTSDGRYFIELIADNATASNASLSIFFNGDTTAANYDKQNCQFTSTTVTAARANDSIITTGFIANDQLELIGWIQRSFAGQPSWKTETTSDETTNILFNLSRGRWRTASNVTSITINSSVSSAFAIGSVLRVWKLAAA